MTSLVHNFNEAAWTKLKVEALRVIHSTLNAKPRWLERQAFDLFEKFQKDTSKKK